MTEMALKALSTLNVRRTEKFPRLTNSVTYLWEKGKECHLRYLCAEADAHETHTAKTHDSKQGV